ncbi:MAG: YdcF family protein [Ruminococcus sp.]|nr:YdcF family protein [Ruminococcus sp.]
MKAEKIQYKKFLDNFTDYIFVENELEKADIIFVPGNGFPQMAEKAAQLWTEGMAPFVLPSGRYSIITGKFVGVQAHQERYQEEYATEWDFLKDVLVKNGVAEDAVLKENQATYTYENAINSRKVTDGLHLEIKKSIICCKAQHARRCQMYYQLLYPETQFMICPVDVGINRENWHLTSEGIEEVLGEMERCGKQFHKILHDLL